jgi:hypothetical protein
VYLLNYPELVQKGVRTKDDAHNHYKKTGYWEKRSCSVSDKFDAVGYMRKHAHLGFKSARDAYVHFMRVGRPAAKNEGFRRNIQPYRLQTAPSARRLRVAPTMPVQSPPPPPLALTPRPPPQPFRRVAVPSAVTMSAKSAPPKRKVKQPKPGELVLNEPPSSYFKKHFTIGPPKYVNAN